MKLACRDRWLWTLLAAAVVVRMVYLISYQQTPLSVMYFADQAYYRTWALQIAGGDWLGAEAFEQAPLYPYLLGCLYRLGGSDTVAMTLQLLSGVVTCLLAFSCADRLFDRKTAIVAGLLAAIYGPLVYYECSIMKSFLSPLLTMAALSAALRYADAGKSVWLFATGVAIGLACLVRENHILLLIPVFTWIWTQTAQLKLFRGQRWMHMAIVAIVCGLTFVPSMLRNFVVSGEFVVVTAGGGEVFYMAHGPDADGSYRPPDFIAPNPNREHEDFIEEAQRRMGRQLSRSESSSYWFREGLREIVADPIRSVQLSATKVAVLLNDYEVPDSSTFTVARSFILVLRLLPSFGYIVGLGLLGGVVCLPRMKEYQLPLGFIAAHAVSIVITYNFGRFRLGMMPVWILLAAHGLLWLISAWRRRSEQGWIAPLAGSILAAGCTLAAFLPPIGYDAGRVERHEHKLHKLVTEYLENEKQAAQISQRLEENPNDAQAHYQLGLVLTELSKPVEAIAQFRAGIRRAPDLADAHHRLGAALAAQGSGDEAAQHLAEALRLNPDLAAAHLDFGELLLNQQKISAAVTHFQRALDIGGDDADRHMWLGIAYMQLGVHGGRQSDFERAETQLKAALRLDPQHAKSYFYLALVYQHQERTAEAIAQLKKAIRAQPEIQFPEAHKLLLRLGGDAD